MSELIKKIKTIKADSSIYEDRFATMHLTGGSTTITWEPPISPSLTVSDSLGSAVYTPSFREYKFCFSDPDYPEITVECTETELQRRLVRDIEAERLFKQWFPDNAPAYERDSIKKIPKMVAEDIIGTLVAAYLIKWKEAPAGSDALNIYMGLAIKLYEDFKLSLDDVFKKLVKAGLEDKEAPQRILDAFNSIMKVW